MSNSNKKVQGEGDYNSAKKFNKKTKDFVSQGKVEKHKNEHKTLTNEEINEGNAAMEKAKSRSRD